MTSAPPVDDELLLDPSKVPASAPFGNCSAHARLALSLSCSTALLHGRFISGFSTEATLCNGPRTSLPSKHRSRGRITKRMS
jgi:hypothetical protein